MKFTLDLDMPATVLQVEAFCAQVRRVHEAHPTLDPIDDVLVHNGPGEDSYADEPLTVEIERAL